MHTPRRPTGKTLGRCELLCAPKGKFVVYEYTAEMMGDPDLTPKEYLFDTESEARQFAEQHYMSRFCRYIILDTWGEIGRVPYE